MNSFKTHLNTALLTCTIGAAALVGVQALAADPQMQSGQTPALSTTAPAPAPTKRVNGLKLEPDGGSGPDKSKFNIVSEKEAKKQQGQLHSGGGNSQTGDGTGGSGPSGGN